MKATDVIKRYADAWNGRDAGVLVDCFTKDGSYCSPDTPAIGGEDLANFARGVWTAFPDLSIEVLKVGEIEPGLVGLHWQLRATNTGPGADGSKPTGRTVSFKGASIIQIEGDKVRSDQAYFDGRALDKQLQPS
jgi:predicted ester cyclase